MEIKREILKHDVEKNEITIKVISTDNEGNKIEKIETIKLPEKEKEEVILRKQSLDENGDIVETTEIVNI